MSEHIISQEDDGIRLDRWFKRHQPGVPHALLEKNLRKGLVRLDGAKAKTSDRVQAGQRLEVRIELPEGETKPYVKKTAKVPESAVSDLRKTILYSDKRMLVLNKPAGLAVQGGSGQKIHVDAMLPYLAKPGEGELKLVHRLDKDTSGILVLAKGPKAAAEIAELFAKKTAEKIYVALVVGVPPQREGGVDLPLIKEAKGARAAEIDYEAVGVNTETGKRAITEYRVLDRLGKQLAWVELRPVTGRMHQLRVHMAAIDCPIVGDGKYGGARAFMKELGLPEKLHLHARTITLPQAQGKPITVHAPLPAHMQESLKLIGQ